MSQVFIRADTRAERLERFNHKERRDKFEIIADVLSIARKGARKTQIVYNANLNFKIVSEYLSFLEAKGFIGNTGRNYTTTEKGEKFLRIYKEMEELFA
ncbi:MAG: transcriptional regulator [Candidatus Methanophagaceae archaeon]|nr:MAG: transcriptional regulator [Methanophagales archaeon]